MDKPRLRTLYFVKLGTRCAGWWDTEPPKIMEFGGLRACPRFRPPDIYHEYTVGGDDDVIRDFCASGVLPPRNSFRIIDVPQEWVAAGLRRVAELRKRRRQQPSNPEVGGLFKPRDVRPIGRDGEQLR